MSTVQDAIRIAKEIGIPVFPLFPNSKRPAIRDFPNRATLDPEKIKAFWLHVESGHDMEFNIGLSTNNLIAIDVDVKNGVNGYKSLLELELKYGPLPMTREHRTTTGGMHMIYKTSTPVHQLVGILPGIDSRALGGYLVGPTSMIDGKSYTSTNLSPLADAPQWLIDLHTRETKPRLAIVKDINQEAAEQRAIDFISSLPPAGQGMRNHECYKAAARIKDFGVNVFMASEIMIQNFSANPPLEPGEIMACVDSAYNHGQNSIGVDSPEAVFDQVVETTETGSSNYPPLKEVPTGPYESLNKEFAVCMAGGSAVILWFRQDSYGENRMEVLAVEAFKTWIADRKIMVGDKPVALSRKWLEWPGRRKYDGIVFEPQRVNPKYYNLWQGFSVAPQKAKNESGRLAIRKLEDHILKNVCAGDKGHAIWVTGWFAHMFQNPGVKVRTALVMRGKKGTGKSIMFDLAQRLLGKHFLKTANKNQVVGNFNSHFEGKLMCVFEEAFWSGDKQADSILKDLITSPKMLIERKGKDPYEIANLLRVAIVGNEEWVVPSSSDERRYAVFDIGDGNRNDQEFFTALMDGMESPALLEYFLNFDISGLNLNVAPSTSGLLRQKELTGQPFQIWWRDCLGAGEICGAHAEGWPEELSTDDFRSAFLLETKAMNIGGRMPGDRYIGKLIRDFCPSVLRGRESHGTRRRTYKLPTLEVAREEYEKFIGHKIDWNEI